MQVARLLPGRTRDAAEPTAGPNAAATSDDTDENGRVCVGGLGACALLLTTATSEHRQRPVLSCTSCMHQLHAHALDCMAMLVHAMVVNALNMHDIVGECIRWYNNV